MTRRRKDPLRVLTEEERAVLEQIARAHSEPASHVARAKIVLAVSGSQTYGQAAQAAGRHSGHAVSQLVSRFNQEGLVAAWGWSATGLRCGCTRTDFSRSTSYTGSGTRWDGNLVAFDLATSPAGGVRRSAPGQYFYDLDELTLSGLVMATGSHLV